MMRAKKASMMDASTAAPGELTQALAHAARASMPDLSRPRQLPLPLAPLARALAPQQLAWHQATNQAAQALQLAGNLPGFFLRGDAWSDCAALAAAVVRQNQALWTQWIEALTDLGQKAGEVPQANTASKYLAHETDLLQQAMQVLGSQATAMARSFENLQINAAWLVSQAPPVLAPQAPPRLPAPGGH